LAIQGGWPCVTAGSRRSKVFSVTYPTHPVRHDQINRFQIFFHLLGQRFPLEIHSVTDIEEADILSIFDSTFSLIQTDYFDFIDFVEAGKILPISLGDLLRRYAR
jgi:hypothetical protein